jgi:outer membrane autotransporter protein
MIQYSATGVDLILSVPPPPAPVTYMFGTYGKTPNQIAAGNAVTAGSPTGALYTSLGGVVTGNTAQMPAALAQLSGDIHASLRSAALQDGRIIRDTVINHAIAGTDTVTVWGTGFGAYGSIDGDGNAAAVHHNDSGVILGADMPVTKGINVGLAVALTGQTASLPTESASASGTTNHVIGYANWTDGSWVASLGWDYGWGAHQVIRRITAFSETDTAHQTNGLNQVFGEMGYRIPTDIVELEPYINFANVNVRTGAFMETGGVAALKGNSASGTGNYATFGVRATAPAISIGTIGMVPDFNLGWEHAFTRFLPGQAMTFAATGESFNVIGVPLGSDSAVIQAALDFALAPDAMLSIGYDGALSNSAQDHAIRGGISWKF